MFTEQFNRKLIKWLNELAILDERLRYECHLPTTTGNGLHAVLEWSEAAGEWRAVFTTASNSIYLTEEKAAEFLRAFQEVAGGQVLKVACSCERCSGGDFKALVASLEKVSHGACAWHRNDMLRMIADLKESA